MNLWNIYVFIRLSWRWLLKSRTKWDREAVPARPETREKSTSDPVKKSTRAAADAVNHVATSWFIFEPSGHNTPHFLDLAKIFIPNASENAYRSSEVGLGRKSFIRRSLWLIDKLWLIVNIIYASYTHIVKIKIFHFPKCDRIVALYLCRIRAILISRRSQDNFYYHKLYKIYIYKNKFIPGPVSSVLLPENTFKFTRCCIFNLSSKFTPSLGTQLCMTYSGKNTKF